MTQRKRYDRDDARKRAGDAAEPSLPAAPPHTGEHIVRLSIQLLHPAPWQPRKVFDDLDTLARSIEGDLHTDGVDILQPILVRRCGDAYEIIDGERRWRACCLIADRRKQDVLVPCRVIEADDALARIIGVVANLERKGPRAVEVALGYQSIRDALRASGRSNSRRSVAAVGPHNKSQIDIYLKIADTLTPAVFIEAGLVSADGAPDYAATVALGPTALHAIAKITDPQERAVALAARCGRAPEQITEAPAPAAPVSLSQRRGEMETSSFSIRVARGSRSLTPEDANELLTLQLAPAVFAVTGAAASPADGAWCFIEKDHEAVMIVVPTTVDALPPTELARLAVALREVSARVRGATRRRRARTARQ